MADFFSALFPSGEGLIELRALPSGARGFFTREDSLAISSFLQLHSAKDLYFGVAAREKRGDGSLANCHELAALFVDIDFKSMPEAEGRAMLERFPLKPSITVVSGGGLHCYWLLREPLDPSSEADGARSLLRRHALAVGGDLASAEPARVLRVPGTLSYKYHPPRRVLIEHFNPDLRYNRSELDDLLPPEPGGDGSGTRFTLPENIRQGERNTRLYQLARILHARQTSDGAILAALREENAARCEPPLPEREVAEIAHHAVRQPDRVGFQYAPRRSCENTLPSSAPALLRLADVQPEAVRWLWPGRIPLGKLTLIIGDPGQGKSMLALDLAARVTRGHPWPDGGSAPSGAAVLLTAEDGLADTVRPRLDAMNGDAARVFVLTGVRHGEDDTPHPFRLSFDLPPLEEAVATSQGILVIIDPLTAYLGKTDSYKDAEVRGVLAPLAAVAERTGVSIVGVMHLTKDAQRRVLYRTQGSLGFVAAARAVFAVAEDHADTSRRLLLPIKLNVGPIPSSLAFRFNGLSLTWESDPVEVDAESVLAGQWPPEEHVERESASEMLRELLADGPVRAVEIKRSARESGISERTLFRVKAALGIKAKRVRGMASGGWWEWELPAPKAAKAVKTAIGENLAALERSGSLRALEEVDL